MAARTTEQAECDWSAEGKILDMARGPRTGAHAQAARANQDGQASADSVAAVGQGRHERSCRGGRIASGGVRTVARDRVSRFRREESTREGVAFAPNYQGSGELPPAFSRPATHGRTQRENR